jgi:hypothetical protein
MKENFDWLDETGTEDWNLIEPEELTGAMERLAAQLIANIQKSARDKAVIDSGDMTNEKSFATSIKREGDLEILELYMKYYADYVNQGVKGWGSSRNAPASPYQFKSKGMNAEGRKSIIASITRSGRKLTDTSKTKVQIGLEKKYAKKTGKKKAAIESQADKIIWMIKKYGIKRTGFLDDAVQKTIKDFKF